MLEKYPIGSFGRFCFTIKKKRDIGIYETPFDVEGAMVTDVDAKNVWLRGTDGVEYLVTKKRITLYEPMKNVDC